MAETEWTLHEAAERLVARLVGEAGRRSAPVSALAARLGPETSTRPHNWLDHHGGPVGPGELAACGYTEGYRTRAGVWRHPGAQLPAIVPESGRTVALRVDDSVAFAAAQNGDRGIEGSPLPALRRAVGHLENLARRGGFKGFNQTNVSATMRATDPLRQHRPGGG